MVKETGKNNNLNIIYEIITIYRKMKRGKNNQNIYRMQFNIDHHGPDFSEVDIENNLQEGVVGSNGKIIDFCRYRTLDNMKYIFYSKETTLIESDDIFANMDILKNKYYWLNIFNPSEKDLEILGNYLGVHDVTLIDIREKNTEEKLEHFKNYFFISLKLLSTCNLGTEDIDFNILIFKNFIITTHDKQWSGIRDILNFLSTISQHTILYPDWVFYSIIIEFLQDVKYVLENVRPESTAQKACSRSINYEMGDNLKNNFEMVYQLYNFRQFIRPKIIILEKMRKSNKKTPRNVLYLLNDCYKDFKRQQKLAVEYNEILERSQDLFLALVDMEQSREANEMNKAMNRFTKIAFVFLPCQTIAGLWGMNVKVPWQDQTSVFYFWLLCAVGPLCSLIVYYLYKLFKTKRKTTVKKF
ncbi:hypothetical protein NCER_100486 [Vairimorpha ceranae BRL01]|uniref:Uncharacterized protein n=2 Tax=Vairimorpha ceranae TaxID=40302 RepID=C4V7Q0_VAIC1|nr:magnesium transporter alr2 [Vairimorpha ceranae]EEQ82741.1 hypothetical protein NCER_100486 [Vairimorpha ceranae BRL01]KAF5140194.1 hypothetical protein G9O61_00g016590 [Vairimorpha ceranae]KKO75164.1 magnesium transporter alr2 [Vairimorpha ceranae]